MALKWFTKYENQKYVAINPNMVVSVKESHVVYNGEKVVEIYTTTEQIYKVIGSVEEVVARLNEKD